MMDFVVYTTDTSKRCFFALFCLQYIIYIIWGIYTFLIQSDSVKTFAFSYVSDTIARAILLPKHYDYSNQLESHEIFFHRT